MASLRPDKDLMEQQVLKSLVETIAQSTCRLASDKPLQDHLHVVWWSNLDTTIWLQPQSTFASCLPRTEQLQVYLQHQKGCPSDAAAAAKWAVEKLNTFPTLTGREQAYERESKEIKLPLADFLIEKT